jgi:hypothetical protein
VKTLRRFIAWSERELKAAERGDEEALAWCGWFNLTAITVVVVIVVLVLRWVL